MESRGCQEGHIHTVVIDAGHGGQRIDNFLLSHLKGVPRSHVYRLLRTGQVRVNKRRAKPGYRLQEGDAVRRARCTSPTRSTTESWRSRDDRNQG